MKPTQRSVLALLDFSRAYDTVWRERLLMCMADKGVPTPYILWIRSFLENRQARVRVNNTLGKSYYLSQGLPQGSVIAPLLFLFYIDNLASLLPKNVIAAMFADDVAFVGTHCSQVEAAKLVQAAVNVVHAWSH